MANGEGPRRVLARQGPLGPGRAVLLRLAEAAGASRPCPRPPPARGGAGPKALFFKNLLESPGKESGAYLHQGVFYIASSLRLAGIPVVLAELKIARFSEADPAGREGLDLALAENPDVNFIGLTLYDSCFEKASELLGYLRRRSRAFLAVGGLMPTLSPEETLVHLPEANFVVRGAGEEAVPRILKILGGSNLATGLGRAQEEALLDLEGVIFSDQERLIWAGAESILRVRDLDSSELDFSLLEKENVASGLVLSLSRGCGYGCLFCTSMDKGRFSGKSPGGVARLLSAYGRRLLELHGRWSLVPPAAFGIGFYDDDFLADPSRALAILRILRRSPFHLRFLQTGINSLSRGKGLSREPDEEILDELGLAFASKGPWGGGGSRLYIGTENFCDRELERLGKGYGYAEVERAALALSRRGIPQAHHFIAANAETTREDVLENLRRIAALRALCGEPFRILEPVIPHLRSFYPTPSYRRLERRGLLSRVRLRGRLSVPGFPEYDYPLVERDVPEDPVAAGFAERLGRAASVDWSAELDRMEELAGAGVP